MATATAALTAPSASPAAPGGRATRRMQRPYQKSDITINDQNKYQKKLLDAAGRYRAFNRENLQIIAVSVENKCFAEANNRREYKRKICKKLREWDYTDFSTDDEDDDGDLDLASASEELYRSVARLSRPRSVPNTAGTFLNHSPPRSKPHQPPQRASVSPPISTSNSSTSTHPTRQPRQSLSARSSPPAAQSFPKPVAQPSLPTPQFSPLTPTGISPFTSLFDPFLLSQIDLNNPVYRDQWVQAVWEHFCSGGNPAIGSQTLPSSRNSCNFSVPSTTGSSFRPQQSGIDIAIQDGVGASRDLDMGDLMGLQLDVESSNMFFYDGSGGFGAHHQGGENEVTDWDMISAGFPPEMLSLRS